ncbi:metallophosphoesterase [Paenibacillus sp. UMB4589-SE434]|uniref:metallophosphoesterase n=1 Tax=Paenibacillus sp. UMB4589-SE434 TaxID=3046314 RepID=UPI00254C6790|nr:metallophosphoesterase [Paenibacillus sp. UMB4589-SE434]MDK8183488.1 metallophosphoesterase [Paenibacillus sp. UMB4589-SE434]
MKQLKQAVRWGTTAIGVLVMLGISAYIYSSMVEPNMLIVTEHVVESEQLPTSFDGTTIVQFSDTHVGVDYSLDQLQDLVSTINQHRPDIVVFNGDLFDNYNLYGAGANRVFEVLAGIQSTIGKYAVYGNHDRGGGANKMYKEGMENAGFTVLVNEVRQLALPNGQSIAIAGLDDFMLGDPDVTGTLSQIKADQFNLVIVHEPDVADRFTAYPINMQLSGHSHGGQVRFPLLGSFITTPLGEKYVQGMYRIQGHLRESALYVNRGIGTTRAKFRLWCAPELSVFTLKKS